MTQEPPHLLVVEDDARLRDRLRRYLGEQGFLVVTAADATEARAQLAAMHFDLLVLDVMLPGEDGISLVRALRPQLDTPIILLTARSEPEDRIRGLEAGADDYVPKPFEPRELVLRIQAILRRAPQDDAEAQRLVRLGGLIFDAARGVLLAGDERIHLTGGEAALLRVLVDNPGTVLTRDQLTDMAMINGNSRTVDVQVTRLRRKIEPDPRLPRFLQTVRGEGYILRPDG